MKKSELVDKDLEIRYKTKFSDKSKKALRGSVINISCNPDEPDEEPEVAKPKNKSCWVRLFTSYDLNFLLSLGL